MEFLETSWKCFRNLKPGRQQWSSGLNVFLGQNGSGKTNVLEIFNVLSGWGVFPVSGNRTSSMVAWDSPDGKAVVSGTACGERDLHVLAGIGERLTFRVSNEKSTYTELRAFLPSLSFLPGDLNLLDGSPTVRRFFLDRLCALCSPVYARRLAEYKQIVRQRTVLLKKNTENSSLRASVTPMAKLGGWIRFVRKRASDLLSDKLSLKGASPEGNLLPFDVDLAMELRGSALDKKNFALEEAVEDIKKTIEANLERERHAGLVLTGPHRDDLLFSCLGRPAALSLSRGQKRRVVMAAILAAGRMIETTLRIKPILILDDVAAELDQEGKALMGSALASTSWQVFASGVEDPFYPVESAVWRVCEGKIS